MNPPVWFDETAFDEDSVLGPDAIPSSDTHDGEFTGIKIDNFVEHNEEYLTFDVSFVEDNSAPVITTSEDDLEFKEIVTVKFNEHIYAGDNWKNVKVTDQDGNPLDATVILPHYPRNEIEVTFKTDAYLDGYKIVIPEGAVKDSSGNEIAAVTLNASKEHYIFPISDKILPNTAEYLRDNGEADFFPEEDSLVIITRLLENRNGEYVQDAKVEFMRLDYNGNVLTQTIVDNPFEKSNITRVMKTGDGCYVFICRENSQSGDYDLLFCVDQNGNLKWTNDDYFGSGVSFFAREGYCSFKLKDGLVMEAHDNGKGMLMRISSETGEIYDCTSEYGDSGFYGYEFFDLGNERVMVQKLSSVNGKHYVCWELVDVKTGKAIAQTEFEGSGVYDYHIQQVKCNDDGTIILTCFMGQSVGAMLLDVDLNVIKSVQLRRIESDGNQMVWLENDGFCEIDRIIEGDHDNDQFHIRRYDRYLNLIWESDVIANFIYYFKSPTGEIMAYKSMLKPDRECYIENYGSEEDRRGEHTHSLVYAEPIEATCINLGSGEYWYCSDCGVRYSDEGLTLIVDVRSLRIPLTDHTKVTIPATDPTCDSSGRTEGTKCSVCGEIFVASQKIPATGNHNYSEWTVTKKATCEKSGIKSRKCSVCGKTETSRLPATGNHSYSEWTVTKEVTCTESGIKSRKCSVCDEIDTVKLPLDDDAHVYGEWTITKEATAESEGEEKSICDLCGKEEVRSISKLEAPAKPLKNLWWIALAVAGVGGVVIAVAIFLRKKNKKTV